jgi:hypothetical protein
MSEKPNDDAKPANNDPSRTQIPGGKRLPTGPLVPRGESPAEPPKPAKDPAPPPLDAPGSLAPTVLVPPGAKGSIPIPGKLPQRVEPVEEDVAPVDAEHELTPGESIVPPRPSADVSEVRFPGAAPKQSLARRVLGMCGALLLALFLATLSAYGMLLLSATEPESFAELQRVAVPVAKPQKQDKKNGAKADVAKHIEAKGGPKVFAVKFGPDQEVLFEDEVYKCVAESRPDARTVILPVVDGARWEVTEEGKDAVYASPILDKKGGLLGYEYTAEGEELKGVLKLDPRDRSGGQAKSEPRAIPPLAKK